MVWKPQTVFYAGFYSLEVADMKIHEEEALTLLSESEHSNIKFTMHTALIFKDRIKVQDTERSNDLNPSTLYNTLKNMTFYVLKKKSTFLSH